MKFSIVFLPKDGRVDATINGIKSVFTNTNPAALAAAFNQQSGNVATIASGFSGLLERTDEYVLFAYHDDDKPLIAASATMPSPQPLSWPIAEAKKESGIDFSSVAIGGIAGFVVGRL